jgi:hypothetical protein
MKAPGADTLPNKGDGVREEDSEGNEKGDKKW